MESLGVACSIIALLRINDMVNDMVKHPYYYRAALCEPSKFLRKLGELQAALKPLQAVLGNHNAELSATDTTLQMNSNTGTGLGTVADADSLTRSLRDLDDAMSDRNIFTDLGIGQSLSKCIATLEDLKRNVASYDIYHNEIPPPEKEQTHHKILWDQAMSLKAEFVNYEKAAVLLIRWNDTCDELLAVDEASTSGHETGQEEIVLTREAEQLTGVFRELYGFEGRRPSPSHEDDQMSDRAAPFKPKFIKKTRIRPQIICYTARGLPGHTAKDVISSKERLDPTTPIKRISFVASRGNHNWDKQTEPQVLQSHMDCGHSDNWLTSSCILGLGGLSAIVLGSYDSARRASNIHRHGGNLAYAPITMSDPFSGQIVIGNDLWSDKSMFFVACVVYGIAITVFYQRHRGGKYQDAFLLVGGGITCMLCGLVGTSIQEILLSWMPWAIIMSLGASARAHEFIRQRGSLPSDRGYTDEEGFYLKTEEEKIGPI